MGQTRWPKNFLKSNFKVFVEALRERDWFQNTNIYHDVLIVKGLKGSRDTLS